MTMPSRTPMSPNDALWLTMDTPENLMVIESVLWFDRRLDVPAVARVLQRRLIDRYPIFGWRPEASEGPVGLDHWAPDPDFDVARHMSVHELPGEGGREEMRAFLEAWMSRPLPRDRPLWQAHVLEGRGFSALMMRFHHAIADGTALARVLIELTSETPEDDDESPASAGGQAGQPAEPAMDPIHDASDDPRALARPPRPRRERAANALSHVATLPLAAGVAATAVAADLVRMLDPDRPDGGPARLADLALGTADAIDKLVVGTPPDVLFFGTPGLAKRADWAGAHSLDAVKRVARTHGATVNDVMIAAISGALRRYQLGRGEVPRDVVTMIPVNLRPTDQPLPAHLGNKFALVAMELPLAEPTPAARLVAAKTRMDVIKRGPEAVLTFGLAHAIGAVGAVTGLGSRMMIDFFSNKAIGVTTNVPGPTGPRYFAGARLAGLLGWVPGASRQAIGVSIVSYDGQIRVGFKTDARVVPDVSALVSSFADEMADLLADGAG